MKPQSAARLYCAAMSVAGLVAVIACAPDANIGYPLHHPLWFAVLAGGVLLGEVLPITIPRRGGDEELTLSASFVMALLLLGGFGPALLAQAGASIIQDRHSGKPWWRVVFNAGQLAVSLAVAWVVVRAVAGGSGFHPLPSLARDQLPAMLLGEVAFFVANNGIVGVAVALYQGVSIPRYFGNNLSFTFLTGGVMLLVAPIVLAAAAYSLPTVLLCLAPMIAMYSSVSQSARYEHAARHDSLTGLLNRDGFSDAVTTALIDPRVPASVLLIDLDRFKDVNDTLGHRFGDLLLVQVVERFRSVVEGAGTIARLGGDEFALVSPGSDRAAALALAERIAESLRDPFELEEMAVDTQASIGIALFPDHGTAVESLLQKADVAMYRAKETGTVIALYEESSDHHSPTKLALSAELRVAVTGEEITVYYQPELDLATDDSLAVEALVRWEHPRLGTLSPDTFIGVAEQTGLIGQLTDRVMNVALGQVATWRDQGLDVTAAVNISPQVLVDRSFTAQVLENLRRAGVLPRQLKLEVTESALMSDPATARTVLQELDALGVQISIDDFGTGYSSLAYLANLPVSEVKIDRSFVSHMAPGSSEEIIVTSTIDLAHHLGLRAVAEGVEDMAMVPLLRSLGCDVVQGYAIGRPMPAPDATRWLWGSRSRVSAQPTPLVAVGSAA